MRWVVSGTDKPLCISRHFNNLGSSSRPQLAPVQGLELTVFELLNVVALLE